MKITKTFKSYNKNHVFLGSTTEKGVPVDLYYNNLQDCYVGRYGDERDNYTAMHVSLAKDFSMVTHILRTAYKMHRNV